MGARTPARPALRPPTGSKNTGSSYEQVSLIHVLGLPTIPSPTTCAPSLSLSHATPQLSKLPPLYPEVWASPFASRLASRAGRIEFVNLRTGRSPPAAPHLVSRRRSCSWLQAGERIPEEDFHLSDQARFQAHWRRHSCLRKGKDRQECLSHLKLSIIRGRNPEDSSEPEAPASGNSRRKFHLSRDQPSLVLHRRRSEGVGHGMPCPYNLRIASGVIVLVFLRQEAWGLGVLV